MHIVRISHRILLSTPLACVAYFFLWYVPDFSEEAKVAWYFTWYCLFQGFLSVSFQVSLVYYKVSLHQNVFIILNRISTTSEKNLKQKPIFSQGIHVPYTAMTMYISKDQRQRDSATAYSACRLPIITVELMFCTCISFYKYSFSLSASLLTCQRYHNFYAVILQYMQWSSHFKPHKYS